MVDAKLIKELRERTGAGFLDCKKALEETNGDVDKAIEILREKGIAKASKKAGRETKEGVIYSYIHGGGRIGVMVEVNCETDFVARNEKFLEFVKNVAMHIAAMNPKYVSENDIPEDVVNKEKEILKKQALAEGKPEHVVEKMVEGRFRKFKEEVCLLNQAYIRDDKKTIGDYLKETIAVIGENIVIRRFVRWELGGE